MPDVGEERTRLLTARTRMRAAVTTRWRRETERLTEVRSRPVLARPETMIDSRADRIARLRLDAATGLDRIVRAGAAQVGRLTAQVVALSPAATLDRGYAVVQRAGDGAVVRSPDDAPARTAVRLRVARGEIAAEVTGATPRKVRAR